MVASGGRVFPQVLEEVIQLGFEHCSFGMMAPLPLTAPRVAWRSNYPPEWCQRYQDRDYVGIDPTLLHAVQSTRAIRWTDDLFQDCPDFRAAARSFGLIHGLTQPHRDDKGMVSVLNVSRAAPLIEATEWKSKIAALQQLAYRCHEDMRSEWRGLLLTQARALVEREIEVLRWAAEGKTSADSARLLGIKESTVNFHIRSACAKMGTASKTAAAAQAAVLGLL